MSDQIDFFTGVLRDFDNVKSVPHLNKVEKHVVKLFHSKHFKRNIHLVNNA